MTNREKEARRFTAYLAQSMPTEKKRVFNNACYRNLLLTSDYTIRNACLTVYKEGWYVEITGCRSKFALFAFDNDGEFEFSRKPKDSKLNYLWSCSFDNDFIYPTADENQIWIELNRIENAY